MKNVIPVIGMSPGNSYFKDDVIERLLKSVVEKFGGAAVLIPNIPAISTYIALGYPENIARRDKALPKGNNLRNKVEKTKAKLKYSSEKVKLRNWENEVENNPDYKEKHDAVLRLYESNYSFRMSVDDATREVLENADQEISDLNTAVKIGVDYLLSEIAFMEFAPQYLGTSKTIYIYHRHWPVYEKYIAGDFDAIKKSWLGFEIVNVV